MPRRNVRGRGSYRSDRGRQYGVQRSPLRESRRWTWNLGQIQRAAQRKKQAEPNAKVRSYVANCSLAFENKQRKLQIGRRALLGPVKSDYRTSPLSRWIPLLRS